LKRLLRSPENSSPLSKNLNQRRRYFISLTYLRSDDSILPQAKIDEEMAKIIVDPGVYLPSNPDGIVIDIDKLSGRPLQSHAKVPLLVSQKSLI
jgi:hypothetical protein